MDKEINECFDEECFDEEYFDKETVIIKEINEFNQLINENIIKIKSLAEKELVEKELVENALVEKELVKEKVDDSLTEIIFEEELNEEELNEEIIDSIMNQIFNDKSVDIENIMDSIMIQHLNEEPEFIEELVMLFKPLTEEELTETFNEEPVLVEKELVENALVENALVENALVENELVIYEEYKESSVFEISQSTNPQSTNPQHSNIQDSNQRLNMALNILLELYRVITCSLLILFVPQNCDNKMCTITQNLESTDNFYIFSLILNFITLFSFCPLYYVEIKRENRLIKYLDVNPELTNHSKDVELVLAMLPTEKRNKIMQIDHQYKKIAYILIGLYIFNVLCSSIVIFQYYLGSQTITVLITFVLFIASKLINVYSVANATNNIFLSSYLKTNVQYNDIDSKYKTEINQL